MPFYEHQCTCGKRFVSRGGYEDASRPCPACGVLVARVEVNDVQIRGDTVPKGNARPGGAGIKDKYGRWKLDLFSEACNDVPNAGAIYNDVKRKVLR